MFFVFGLYHFIPLWWICKEKQLIKGQIKREILIAEDRSSETKRVKVWKGNSKWVLRIEEVINRVYMYKSHFCAFINIEPFTPALYSFASLTSVFPLLRQDLRVSSSTPHSIPCNTHTHTHKPQSEITDITPYVTLLPSKWLQKQQATHRMCKSTLITLATWLKAEMHWP